MNFEDLGNLIRSEREKRSWEQADLAKRLDVTQQTVSRWEKGDSRPKQAVLSKLVELFSGEDYVWYTKAGYDFDEPDTSLSPYLPLQNLSAENFELFCRDLVKSLNPGADVHRYGTQGYKQDGIDLYAKNQAAIMDYQCKRHRQFGAADIKTAIKKTTLRANHHFLLLSRTATPPARKEINKYKKWTLWDKEDISLQVRSLPKDNAVQLVDTYFPGKRKSFLGVEEPSPWLTTKEYFLPFMDRLRIFSHGWKFVGRSKELAQLKSFETTSTCQAIIVSGHGGVGKSRLVRAWAESVEQKGVIRFLSSGSEVDTASLELLPKGPAFLVIDDAHDRSDILLILNGIARTRLEMKIILCTRPYGNARLKADLSKSGLSLDSEESILLNELSVEDTKRLAEEVLADPSVNGNIVYAQRIAEITMDCPFATVIGSRLVGQGTIKPDLLINDGRFREELLSRFRDIVAGEIGGARADEVQDLLDLLATVQPFNPTDLSFQSSATEIIDKPYDKILRQISLLEDSGVLSRRGHRLRVVPDLLGDYIRAHATYDDKNQRPTGYVDRLFEKLQDEYATNLLVNISQLDWRLSAGGIQASLLGRVWSNIKEQFRKAKIYERAAILEAIKKVSYYHPRHTLDLIRLAIEEPTDQIEDEYTRYGHSKSTYEMVLHKIPTVLRYVAYDANFLVDTLDLLRMLAGEDTRPANSNPDHPVRVLQDIASIEPGKPFTYNEIVAKRAISWLQLPSKENFSPFDVFDALLKTEGHQIESKGYTEILKPFVVKPQVVSSLRQELTDEAFRTIYNGSLRDAMRALKTIAIALSYPHGILGYKTNSDERASWDPGILAILEGLKDVVINTEIDPYISVEIRSAISWHATHGSDKTKPASKEVLAVIPETLDYEVSRAIADGWGRTFDKENRNYEYGQVALLEWRKKVAENLIRNYTQNLTGLIAFLEDRINTLNFAKISQTPDAGPFLRALMENSREFSDMLGQHLLSNPSSPLIGYLGLLIAILAKEDRPASLLLARAALKKDEIVFMRNVAWSLGWGIPDLEIVPEEIKIIRRLSASEDVWVKHTIVRVSKRFSKESKSTGLDILLSIDINGSSELAEEVLGEFEERHGAFNTEDLTDDQVQNLLDSLVKCPSIGGYHISLFLSKISFTHPLPTLKMLMDRVEYNEANPEAKLNEERYDALPYSFREGEALRFHETAQYEQLLRTVRNWAAETTDNWLRTHYGADLFKLVSAGFDEITLNVLQEWIMSADEQLLEKAATLLSEANNTFVWDHQDFVINILERARNYGNTCYKRVTSALYGSVIQGVRSGTPGQPFPEDIAQRDRSFEMISKLPPGSAAHKFYKTLYEEAKNNIDRRSFDISEY